jgi:hypothetical protein
MRDLPATRKEITMNRFIPLSAAALLFAMTGLAQATQTISSPSIFASDVQRSATCTVRNVGTTQVLIRQVGIVFESGDPVTLASDNCTNVRLAGGSACSVTATGILTGFAYACSATAASVKHLRGAMFLRIPAGSVSSDLPFRSAPLR